MRIERILAPSVESPKTIILRFFPESYYDNTTLTFLKFSLHDDGIIISEPVVGDTKCLSLAFPYAKKNPPTKS